MGEPKFPLPFLLFIFVLSLNLFHGVKSQPGFELETWRPRSSENNTNPMPWQEEDEEAEVEREDGEEEDVQSKKTFRQTCDYSVGKWVFDPSYPLYDASCPYISGRVSCRKNGRPDSVYEKWRWKPQGCSITRFNALAFLGKMRRKRIMLVGDSIMRNQWESLVCLVDAVIPKERKTVSYHGISMAFHALDFEASIEFSWAPLLVELKLGGPNGRILDLDSIEGNAKYWKGVDILVFDSAHWWTHTGSGRSWDYYMEGGRLFKNLNPMVAYEKGLSTWAKWVDLNLDPRRTRVIFRSVSPKHNRQNGQKCYNQHEPVRRPSYTPHVPPQLVVVRGVLRSMRFPVYLLDISEMSMYRKDGHPSVFTWPIKEQQRAPLDHYASDCSHWCLPGVPDAWNEILYASIM
ncbi:hypothetical protein AMTRI_Chr11g96090 [Amborella trichopoda]|uniref:Uncharacterized protein n=1 Tax=Amborella trichopoda TaxID=13333 RepID=W1NUE4_AMBTC|nr:protein trichome birefringence-like 36 [Amborella trichopoda]ERM98895.1 hypothetical protein AMTR_s00114p00046060 [Amborella trichopoda]|eukprot:XP_006836042.1 protein trichome birefringence-like 36 [Amborella trichopoda]